MSGKSATGSAGAETEHVVDNPARSRFELKVGGEIAFADYRLKPGLLAITHVETPPDLQGGGVAARVMKGVLDYARDNGLKVAPLCPYAEVYIRRHPEYRDLVG
ncbi:MAG TPA: GNAT family N-acetyltransferase [Caulobacteraceae bacterium]|nr:GNAT family N-acetyltransferase [Caulobacteraceae bacterium]